MPPENGFSVDKVFVCDSAGNPMGPVVDFGTMDDTTCVGCDVGSLQNDWTIEMSFDIRNGTRTQRTIKRLQYGWQARGPVRKKAVVKALNDYGRRVGELWKMW